MSTWCWNKSQKTQTITIRRTAGPSAQACFTNNFFFAPVPRNQTIKAIGKCIAEVAGDVIRISIIST